MLIQTVNNDFLLLLIYNEGVNILNEIKVWTKLGNLGHIKSCNQIIDLYEIDQNLSIFR